MPIISRPWTRTVWCHAWRRMSWSLKPNPVPNTPCGRFRQPEEMRIGGRGTGYLTARGGDSLWEAPARQPLSRFGRFYERHQGSGVEPATSPVRRHPREIISGRSAGPQGDVPALSAQRHRAFEKERTSATGILNSRARVALALILCRHTRGSKQRLPGSCADGRTGDPISVRHLEKVVVFQI